MGTRAGAGVGAFEDEQGAPHVVAPQALVDLLGPGVVDQPLFGVGRSLDHPDQITGDEPSNMHSSIRRSTDTGLRLSAADQISRPKADGQQLSDHADCRLKI